MQAVAGAELADRLASCPMSRQIVLLRGINLGPRNRVAMPDLARALEDAGFDDVRTYLQSGNVVLSCGASPEQVRRECEALIERRLGLQIDVVVRTRDELSEVVRRNPLGAVAVNPKRYQVSFLAGKPPSQILGRLRDAAGESERFVLAGREIYAWYPEGVGRSRLWALLASRALGVTSTARNWTTVTSLLALADGEA